MEIKDFIVNFGDQLEDTDITILTADTKFRLLDEWSSLTALSVLAMLDEVYDVQLKAVQMRNCNTIGELFELVKSLKD